MKLRGLLLSFALLAAFASCVSCIPMVIAPPTAVDLQKQRSTAVEIIVSMLADGTGHESELESPTPTMVAIGSGVVIGVKGEQTMVLTAAHICEREPVAVTTKSGGTVTVPVLKVLFIVRTVDNRELLALPVHFDTKTDLCVMLVAGIAGSPAVATAVEPPIGAPIVYVGAPNGIWNAPGVPIIEGRYSGTDVDNTILSMPVVGGASGSGVFYDGRLFSVVSKHAVGFDGIGYGTPVHETYQFVKTAQDAFYAQ